MTNPKSPSYKFKKAWSWPTEIEAKIKSLCEGFTLHVCSGDSALGDVRLDLSKPADIKGDMFHLPFRRDCFDTVLCDPPWHLPYHQRGKVLRELRDCIKPGGRLVFNCFWFPRTRGLDVDPEIFVGVPNNLWRNASLLITARRSALQGPYASIEHFAHRVLDDDVHKEEYRPLDDVRYQGHERSSPARSPELTG